MAKKDKNKQLPELYTEKELEAIEEHIVSMFGDFENVFHEIESPDIHVDVCIIDPTPERNYYTLVTMGMGAHRMNVPEELRDKKVDRAEVLIALPPDWDLQNPDERWYWPIRCIKSLARLPGELDTWLSYGHTVSNEEPYADNTGLCGVMLTFPYCFPAESAVCVMPDGDEVNFYQVLPLYANEMNFKVKNNAEALENMFPEDFDMVVDPARKNVLPEKDWHIKAADMKDLFHWDEAEGCFATDRILVDGCKVGYMYREEPDGDWDSGWRFTAGDESEEYMDTPGNSGIYALNTVANNDPEIIPFLTAPYGSSFIRDDDGVLREDEGEDEE
ncbi:MAG: DUF2185 domain-containing protein [Methanomassiliicoccaceae archaeon]|nr:DUF2185 domain-containing protein [Methanomassiliicoccaceae archaeon]